MPTLSVEKFAGDVGGVAKSNGPAPLPVTRIWACALKLRVPAAPTERNNLENFITDVMEVLIRLNGFAKH